jgi:hypothetical protein
LVLLEISERGALKIAIASKFGEQRAVEASPGNETISDRFLEQQRARPVEKPIAAYRNGPLVEGHRGAVQEVTQAHFVRDDPGAEARQINR